MYTSKHLYSSQHCKQSNRTDVGGVYMVQCIQSSTISGNCFISCFVKCSVVVIVVLFILFYSCMHSTFISTKLNFSWGVYLQEITKKGQQERSTMLMLVCLVFRMHSNTPISIFKKKRMSFLPLVPDGILHLHVTHPICSPRSTAFKLLVVLGVVCHL